MRGKTSRSVMVGGARRTFIAYLPASADPATPTPLVYVFHGANQTGQILYDMTEYWKIADSEGIAVVFPDGQGASSETGLTSLTPWYVTDGELLCGLGTLVSNFNDTDLAFIDEIKADVLQDQCVDDDHVFVTGFSMGGYFSHYVACKRPDFRAAGPHSGGTMANLSSCATQRMPMIIFHGNVDPLINEGCSDPMGTLEPGFPAAPTLWAQRNGCQDTYSPVTDDGANGECYLYDGCPADGQVKLCIFDGLAHAWSGAPVCDACIGLGIGFPSATRIEWDFFKKHAW
jgi:polyhydroxybutyrate depolymerase